MNFIHPYQPAGAPFLENWFKQFTIKIPFSHTQIPFLLVEARSSYLAANLTEINLLDKKWSGYLAFKPITSRNYKNLSFIWETDLSYAWEQIIKNDPALYCTWIGFLLIPWNLLLSGKTMASIGSLSTQINRNGSYDIYTFKRGRRPTNLISWYDLQTDEQDIFCDAVNLCRATILSGLEAGEGIV